MAMTNPRQQAALQYGRKLRTALEETGTSIYRLSRKLNEKQPESARSNIQRYLAGRVLPGIESRAELAETLGRPELRTVDADDEEADPMAHLADALMFVVKAHVAAELAKSKEATPA